jgi:hypothetical protein
MFGFARDHGIIMRSKSPKVLRRREIETPRIRHRASARPTKRRLRLGRPSTRSFQLGVPISACCSRFRLENKRNKAKHKPFKNSRI